MFWFIIGVLLGVVAVSIISVGTYNKGYKDGWRKGYKDGQKNILQEYERGKRKF